MNFLKKSDKYINFDLLYCTNIHFGESFQDVFFILKFYSRKFRNILFSYYIFYVGLRLSNFSIIYLSKFSLIILINLLPAAAALHYMPRFVQAGFIILWWWIK